jgi:hypothetical protein
VGGSIHCPSHAIACTARHKHSAVSWLKREDVTLSRCVVHWIIHSRQVPSLLPLHSSTDCILPHNSGLLPCGGRSARNARFSLRSSRRRLRKFSAMFVRSTTSCACLSTPQKCSAFCVQCVLSSVKPTRALSCIQWHMWHHSICCARPLVSPG